MAAIAMRLARMHRLMHAINTTQYSQVFHVEEEEFQQIYSI